MPRAARLGQAQGAGSGTGCRRGSCGGRAARRARKRARDDEAQAKQHVAAVTYAVSTAAAVEVGLWSAGAEVAMSTGRSAR